MVNHCVFVWCVCVCVCVFWERAQGDEERADTFCEQCDIQLLRLRWVCVTSTPKSCDPPRKCLFDPPADTEPGA